MSRHLCLALSAASAFGAVHVTNPLVTGVYTADPTVLVDGGRAWLYTGHDEVAPEVKGYRMKE